MPELFDTKKREDIINNILKDLPATNEILVDLPSEGKFYKSFSGDVLVRPLTFDDEKFIISNKKEISDEVNVILSRCIKGVKIEELFLCDKLFLLLKLREVSYGNDYAVSITCPKCEADLETVIDLGSLIVDKFPKNFKDPREITLPVLKKKIKIRLPRVNDEKYLSDPETLFNSLWRFIEELDGHTDRGVISGVVNKLPVKDCNMIISNIKPKDIGVDPRFIYKCGSCKKDTIMEVPITPDFFTGN